MFYRNSKVAIVCFDKDAIDTIEDWIERVKTEEPDCEIILAATKDDMLKEEDIASIEQQVKPILEEKHLENFFFTSSKTGNGVKTLFQAAALFCNNIPESETIQPVKQNKKCC